MEDENVASRAVGAILYEMVVGYPPFFSDDAVTTCLKIVNWRKYLKYPEGVSSDFDRAFWPERKSGKLSADMINCCFAIQFCISWTQNSLAA